MDEFVTAVPAHIIFSLAASAIFMALYLPRVSLFHRRKYELVMLAMALVVVSFMTTDWGSVVVAVLIAILVFTLRWSCQFHRPWLAAVLLSAIALAAAFLPQWPDLGARLVLQAGDVTLLAVHFRPTPFVVALNLIPLSASLSPRLVTSTRAIQFPVSWSVGFIIVAFVLGWWLGGIHIAADKWRSIMGLSYSAQVLIVVALLGHALMLAAIEESFFRGVLIPVFERMISAIRGADASMSALVALGVSSLLFGLAHMHLGWSWVLGSSLAGIGYGILYVTYRRMVSPIFLHAIVVLILTTYFSV